MALEKARFIIVPGNAGDELTRELHGIASGDGIAPWARVVHEQWIKHCFRDQSVLSPDDYLARASSQPSEADSAAATSDDDEVSDVPPRDVLVRVNKIIKAVRDWKAGKIKTKTNYKTVYNFVDNLSSTQVSFDAFASADKTRVSRVPQPCTARTGLTSPESRPMWQRLPSSPAPLLGIYCQYRVCSIAFHVAIQPRNGICHSVYITV